MKILTSLLLSFCLMISFSSSVRGETIIIPVNDLLFEIPDFKNAPDFNMTSALNGSWTPELKEKTVRKNRRQLEKKLVDIMWDEYPDAQSIRIWNGNMIIRRD